MANIRKLYEADQTTQLMPQTHEKAVVDDNGTTAETKFGLLFEAYNSLTQSDIVVVADHTAVSSPQANTIYREQGTSSYSDWMYYGSAWKKMAEYDNAIDAVPTAGSNNLVKSGGVKQMDFERILQITPPRAAVEIGGTETLRSVSINSEGVITTESSSDYRVVYTINQVPKGTLLHFTATSSDSRRQCFCAMATDPKDSENPIGVGTQLTIIKDMGNVGNWDEVVEMPFDGWFVYYYYNSNTWSNRLVYYHFPSEVLEVVRDNTITIRLPWTILTNKIMDSTGLIKAPSSGNGNRRVIQVNVSSLAGQTVYFRGYNNYSGSTYYIWAVYTSQKVTEDVAVRVMDSGHTAKGAVTGSVEIQEGDTWLCVVYYAGNTCYAEIQKKNVELVSELSDEVIILNKRIDNIYEEDLLKNFMQKYPYSARKFLRGDTGLNYGSTYGTSGYYYTTGYIDISNFDVLSYKLPFPNKPYVSTGGVAMLAAFDADKVYIPENSVIYTSKNSSGIGEWTRGEDTVFVRFTIYHKNGSGKYYAIDPSSYEYRISKLEGYSEDPNNILTLNKDRECILNQTTWESTKSGASPKKWLRLAHFSDLHGDTTRLRRIVEWCEEHNDILHDVVNTGDTVASQYSNANPFASVDGSEKILTAIGNHDCAGKIGNVTDWYKNRGVNAYNKFIKPYITTTGTDLNTQQETIIDNWGVTQPEDAEENGYCYYYKDYDTGFRLIVLDAMNYTVDGHQRAWFQNVLEDARTNNLSVVCAFHFCIRAKLAIKTNFASWGSGDGTGYGNSTIDGVTTYNSAGTIFTDTQSFIDAGGKFVCHLVGHSHSDKIFFAGTTTKVSTSESTKQLCLMVDAACCTSSADHWSAKRIAEGRTQDSFNVVAINKTDKRIIIIKIGCDANIIGQHVDWVCINYDADTIEQLYTVGNASYISENYVEPEHDDDGDVD